MSQKIDVTVKDFSVTKCFDPKQKTDVVKKFEPQSEKSLSGVTVDPPKGKTPAPYSVDITVEITKTDKAVKAVVKVVLSKQDPYSKKDLYVAGASGSASAGTTNPTKDDVEAVVDAALKEAVKTTIKGVQDDAKKP
jgi:hypothetical protein